MQSADHQEAVLGQQHNQTIMITGSQPPSQPQQPSQTPPSQQVRLIRLQIITTPIGEHYFENNLYCSIAKLYALNSLTKLF